MIYLIEIESVDAAGDPAIHRFGSDGYTTEPGDTPANVHFEHRVKVPGDFTRHLFGDGRTYGGSSVGAGEIDLVNVDGALDYLLDHAFDGRELRIYRLVDRFAPWASRVRLFTGTMDGVTFPDGALRVELKERLEALRVPMQATVYAGTTTEGGLAEAEGGEDLKDKEKPLLFGGKLNIPPALVDAFDLIYQVAANALSAISAVRDRGVPLLATSDHADLAALKAATLAPGEYATCIALGLVRLGGSPDGVITADAVEGAAVGDRTAAQVVRRVLEYGGFTEGADFLASDIAALDAFNSAECGIWLPGDTTEILTVVVDVLGSIGASIAPDRAGVLRLRAFEVPSGVADLEIDEVIILEDGAISRSPPNDDGEGKPAKKVTVRYARNHSVQDAEALEQANTTEAIRTFAAEEWRQVSSSSEATAVRHPLAQDLTFDTVFRFLADAQAEADRRLALYQTRRDVFRIAVKAEYATDADLGAVVNLTSPRFGMQAGRLLRVIGLLEDYDAETITMILWG